MHARPALLLALAFLGACRPDPEPRPTAAASATAPPAGSASASPRSAGTVAAAPPDAPGLALPERFTALGTEPFWAAKVDGSRLTYQTPEDQAGHPITVTRAAGKDSVELDGTLDGKALRLTVTAGPCSDGMSDTVYPFAVTRGLGEDVQRGCARRD